MLINATGSLLDMCVLAIVSRGDAYGYALTQDIKQVLNVSESTMYPVMRRLMSQDCLETYDIPHDGRNRRYYRLTDGGVKLLRSLTGDWNAFKQKIDGIIAGGEAA